MEALPESIRVRQSFSSPTSAECGSSAIILWIPTENRPSGPSSVGDLPIIVELVFVLSYIRSRVWEAIGPRYESSFVSFHSQLFQLSCHLSHLLYHCRCLDCYNGLLTVVRSNRVNNRNSHRRWLDYAYSFCLRLVPTTHAWPYFDELDWLV
jgi:hypothetical protein